MTLSLIGHMMFWERDLSKQRACNNYGSIPTCIFSGKTFLDSIKGSQMETSLMATGWTQSFKA